MLNQMNFQVENKINHESYHTPCKNLNTQVYRGNIAELSSWLWDKEHAKLGSIYKS